MVLKIRENFTTNMTDNPSDELQLIVTYSMLGSFMNSNDDILRNVYIEGKT